MKHLSRITEKGSINVDNGFKRVSDKEIFIERAQKLKEWDKAILAATDALGVDLLEGTIGDMYNEWFEITFDLLKGTYPDEMMDAANKLLYELPNVTWDEWAKFYDKWKGV